MVSRRTFLAVGTAALAAAGPALSQQIGSPMIAAKPSAAKPSAASPSAAGPLKVLSAGSTLYGLRPAAEQFSRGSGIAVTVTTDHGHNIRKAVLDAASDADMVLAPAEWIDEMVAAGRADSDGVIAIG